MNPLDLLGGAARGYILAGLVAVAVAAVGGAAWKLRHAGVVTGRAEVQALWDKAKTAADEAAKIALAKVEKDEAKTTTTQARVTNDIETKRRAPARDAAVAAAAVGGGLHHAAEPVIASGRATASDPTATGECQAAGAAKAVLAELLRDGEERRIELARYADEAGAAGAECVGRYDALMETPP